jgi:exodeoxyribonuclease V gamma subunit
MAGLKHYTGNRLETLARYLADCIRPPLSSPLTPETIVVQSRGMERWLSMALARRHGICANVRFPFPNAFLDDLFRIMLPQYRDSPAYDPQVLAWRIMRALPACLPSPDFTEIRRYLQADAGGLKRYQLACNLADLFDQYLVFRPDMILAWETGKNGRGEEAWQAGLWRKIRENDRSTHPALLRRAFMEQAENALPTEQPLPERVSIFGISWLPRFHLEIFHALSRRLDMHLFTLNPCREFWTHIRSDREAGRAVEKIRESSGRKSLSPADLHLEAGNSLLASMGTHGREFFRGLMELNGEEYDCFSDPGETTLLQAIQSDILNLSERGRNGLPKAPVDPLDRSLQIHSCHSPMREVEALHDQILALFDDDPELLPRDILVMAPDMETYAPLIQSVFDAPAVRSADRSNIPRIPFTIADRSFSKDSPLLDGFLDLLELAGSRFEASSVLALLDAPAVRRKFGLSDEDMERIRRWVSGACIRWGIDAESRLRMGLPEMPDNTWAAGLQRLFLGYALPGKDERLFNGILPYDAIEGQEAQTLGRLAEYLHGLFECAALLNQARTPGEWTALLSSLLDQFFDGGEESQTDLQEIRRGFQRLTQLSERSGFDDPLTVDMIKFFLRGRFEQQGSGTGYISGGVTCCTMLPMRSIPFKVICLLGMNHDGYPRPSHTTGFDLITKHPRPGDRSRRHDDRYLFLEALLSARQKLIISYVGRTVADNAPLPPSVVVSELLDVVEQGFERSDGATGDMLVTNHRLQAFHPSYFSINSSLFSYSEENSHAARRLFGLHETPVFFACPLPDPGEDWKIISIRDLVRFFRNPCRFLLERRLAATLTENTDIPIDRETFDVRGLEKYQLEQRLVDQALAGQTLAALYPLFRASGRLPLGNVGVSRYGGLIREADRFVARIKSDLAASLPEPADICLDLAGFRVHGRIENLHPEGLLHFRYADLRSGDYLQLWIHHLILLSSGRDLFRSTLIGRSQAWSFAQAENAPSILEPLLNLYWNGLSFPLKFFPESSLNYVGRLLNGKRAPEALRAARSVWTGSNFKRGESQDPYYRRCFGEQDPLDEEFQRLAVLVYEPLLKRGRLIDRENAEGMPV